MTDSINLKELASVVLSGGARKGELELISNILTRLDEKERIAKILRSYRNKWKDNLWKTSMEATSLAISYILRGV